MRPSFVTAGVSITAFMPQAALASVLGQASSPAVPWGRILAALIISLMIALAAILWVKRTGGSGGGRFATLSAVFIKKLPAREIDIVETRRISPHADICLVRHGGRDYLLAVSAHELIVLNESDQAAQPAIDEPGMQALESAGIDRG